VNLVIVRRVTGNVEKGLYIYLVFSSYIPMGSDDGFQFSGGEGNVYKFTRTLAE
jgi:hypothetical protein